MTEKSCSQSSNVSFISLDLLLPEVALEKTPDEQTSKRMIMIIMMKQQKYEEKKK